MVGVRAGTLQPFSVVVGATSGPVAWSVNGVVGGNATLGTIDTSGLYTAPWADPGIALTIRAGITNPASFSTASVGWQNPIPTLVTITPNTVNVGTVTVNVIGSGFVQGSQVKLNNTACPTVFLTSNQLSFQATFTQAQSPTVVVVNPSPGSAASHPLTLKVWPTPTLQLSPSSASIRLGDRKSFLAQLANCVDSRLVWSVNGEVGGSTNVGKIDTNGVYAAPMGQLPGATVVVTAASVVNPSVNSSATVTLLNPLPLIQSLTPAVLNFGIQSVTVRGTGFVPGSQVVCDGMVLPTTYETANSLTA